MFCSICLFIQVTLVLLKIRALVPLKKICKVKIKTNKQTKKSYKRIPERLLKNLALHYIVKFAAALFIILPKSVRYSQCGLLNDIAIMHAIILYLVDIGNSNEKEPVTGFKHRHKQSQ